MEIYIISPAYFQLCYFASIKTSYFGTPILNPLLKLIQVGSILPHISIYQNLFEDYKFMSWASLNIRLSWLSVITISLNYIMGSWICWFLGFCLIIISPTTWVAMIIAWVIELLVCSGMLNGLSCVTYLCVLYHTLGNVKFTHNNPSLFSLLMYSDLWLKS